MLDMLLIPLFLPSIDVNDETPLPTQVEMAYRYQDRNPYKCVEMINAYIDNGMSGIPTAVTAPADTVTDSVEATVKDSASDTVADTPSDIQAQQPEDNGNMLHADEAPKTPAQNETAEDNIAVQSAPEPSADKQTPAEPAGAAVESITEEVNKQEPETTQETADEGHMISETEEKADTESSLENQLAMIASSSREQTNGITAAAVHQASTDTDSEKEKHRLQFFHKKSSPEKDAIFNALTSCKIKVGLAKTEDFRSRQFNRKNNLTSIINNYNRIRVALQNNTLEPNDIRFIETPTEINRDNYQKIKPYIQLIELYKLIQSNNLKAVPFFENSVNDPAFNSYPESVKNAFWMQGFTLYNELNHKNIAYYMLNQVEKSYAGKTQFTYNNAILSKLLSDIFLENNHPELADEHLSRYVSVIEQFPQEQVNYLENLMKLSEIKISIGHQNDALTLLKKADNLINYTPLNSEDDERLRENLGHLYIKVGDYDRALFYMRSSGHDYSFDSENTQSIGKLIDLAVALNGTGQTSNASQLMKTLSTYIAKIPEEHKPKYYHTLAIINATQGNYADAYKNLETAFNLNNKLNDKKKDGNNHIIPSPVFYQNYMAHNNNVVNIPVRMLIVLLSGFTILFLIVSLALMRYYNKSKELEREIDRLEDDYPQSFGGDIKNYNDFLNFVIRQSMNYHQSDDDQGTKNIDLINNKDIYQIFIPGFTDLSIKRGYKQSQNQRNAFIDKLQNLIHIASDIYVINDSRYIIVTKPNTDMDPFTMSNTLITKVEQVLKELHIDPVVNAGIISFPFINSSPYSLESNRIFELLSLALAGARTISEHNQKSSFVRLTANRLDKSSIQDGDTYIRAINCIKKGSIKTITLPEESQVDWQQIQEDIML